MITRTKQHSNGETLRFTTDTGRYLGSIEFDLADRDCYKLLGDAFQSYCAQQTGGIQLASGLPVLGSRNQQ